MSNKGRPEPGDLEPQLTFLTFKGFYCYVELIDRFLRNLDVINV
jgi:hypothetical protein